MVSAYLKAPAGIVKLVTLAASLASLITMLLAMQGDPHGSGSSTLHLSMSALAFLFGIATYLIFFFELDDRLGKIAANISVSIW